MGQTSLKISIFYTVRNEGGQRRFGEAVETVGGQMADLNAMPIVGNSSTWGRLR